MTQKVVSLVLLLLICGSVAAKPVKHLSKSIAAIPSPAPKETKAAPKEPPANELFGAAASPAPLASRAIGSYARGCLAGGVALPINGPDWQVMRLSRNRNWGHPRLLDFLERFAADARNCIPKPPGPPSGPPPRPKPPPHRDQEEWQGSRGAQTACA
jgi:murein endopeptidase